MDPAAAVERLAYRPAEVAKLLGISRSKTYELLNEGALPHFKCGSSIRVPAEGLREWVEAQTREQAEAAGR